MGAYANCWIGNLVAVSSKNVVDPNVLALFDRADRIFRRSDDTDLPECVVLDMGNDDDEPYDVVYLETSARVARDRLELAGFTLDTARRLFDESMSFAAAGILNRTIAQLPDLPMLRSYPTIGPTGPADMDVNGIAASIELYLGVDALRDDQGCLPAVQWTG
jgi:hypothetical protein